MTQKCLYKSMFAIAAMATAVISCSKEDAQQPINNIDAEFGKFTKELTIFDEEKNNSAVLLVGSDDESVLNMWTADNFTLIPIREGQTLADVFESNAPEESLDEEDEVEDGDEDENVAASISTRFISKNLQDGVKNVALQITDPYDESMRGWKYGTHECIYAGGNNIGEENRGWIKCTVYGHNPIHRGFYGISFLNYSYSTKWFDLVSEWKRIKNKDSDSKTAICYKMKATRKYKGSNNSVTVAFAFDEY